MLESAKEITDQMECVRSDSCAFSKIYDVHLVTYDFITHDGLFRSVSD